MNNVIVTGNICKEVKCEKTKNGKVILRNTIAVKDGYKTDYEKTYFINFEVYGTKNVMAFQNLKKGNLIELHGKLVVESYKNKEDKWINITKIVVFKAEKINFERKNFTPVNDDELPF